MTSDQGMGDDAEDEVAQPVRCRQNEITKVHSMLSKPWSQCRRSRFHSRPSVVHKYQSFHILK